MDLAQYNEQVKLTLNLIEKNLEVKPFIAFNCAFKRVTLNLYL